MGLLLSLFLSLGSVNAGLEVQDIAGRFFRPFQVEGTAKLLLFLSPECPISLFYATQIQRVCREYAGKNVSCVLVFEDLEANSSTIRAHMKEFGYQGIPAVLDRKGIVAKQAGATVTPQAVLIGRSGAIHYRGRIDNFYAELGKSRRQATVHDLRDALAAVSMGRPAPQAETTPIGCFIVFPEMLKEAK